MQKIYKNIDTPQYLSEVIDYLPSNCILNKGITGCGGTYLELHSNRNSVILVPTIELVKNKTEEGIQPVYGKIKNKEILDYLSSDIPYKKIIGTYDSIIRIIHFIDPKEYFLLIDEYHLLFNSYVFRDIAVKNVLNNFRSFNAFCFMSATPLNDLCILEELEDLPQITYIWTKATQMNIDVIDTYFTTTELFHLFNKDTTCNWHIFLNSVQTIRQIISKLDTDDYKVVCSTMNQSKGIKLNYGTTLDPPKKYNFYTSCSFEGTDIYDKFGRTAIICDTNIATTILDISTLIRQICGRLRNSIYKDQATLILNTSKHRYAKVSPSQFDIFVHENIKYGKRIEEQFTSFDERDKIIELRKYSPETYNSMYVNRYDNQIFYDDNLRKMDEYNYHLVNEIYSSAITVMYECTQNNLKVELGENKGETWVKDKLYKKEWAYSDLESTFCPLFALHGLSWNKNTSIDEYFPTYTKKRKTRNGVKETYYTFNWTN